MPTSTAAPRMKLGCQNRPITSSETTAALIASVRHQPWPAKTPIPARLKLNSAMTHNAVPSDASALSPRPTARSTTESAVSLPQPVVICQWANPWIISSTPITMRITIVAMTVSSFIVNHHIVNHQIRALVSRMCRVQCRDPQRCGLREIVEQGHRQPDANRCENHERRDEHDRLGGCQHPGQQLRGRQSQNSRAKHRRNEGQRRNNPHIQSMGGQRCVPCQRGRYACQQCRKNTHDPPDQDERYANCEKETGDAA